MHGKLSYLPGPKMKLLLEVGQSEREGEKETARERDM